MSLIGDYLKETRTELHHVAWPTQAQTIVYTVLVALISLFVAGYLGVFDFLFTSTLTKVVSHLPNQAPVTVTQTVATSSVGTSTSPVATTTKQ